MEFAMRSENHHQVIICTTDAKRIAVLDVETKPGDYWNEHCAVVLGKWLFDNPGHRLLSNHVANGNMTVWVKQLH
jgi:hypothetical protein